MELQTNRLKIMPVTLERLEQFQNSEYPLANLPPHIKWSLDELKKDESFLGWGVWLVVEAHTSQLIGDIGFKGMPTDLGVVEVGYRILPFAQNKGYATEAVKALLDWAFQTGRVQTVIADCEPDNLASIQVLKKLGMTQIGDRAGLLLWQLRHNGLVFKSVSEFNRGILFDLLSQSYAFDEKYEQRFKNKWQENDNFFFDNLEIANRCCFVTTLNEEPIGFTCYDPRNLPKFVIIGDNCIIPKFKGKGYGILQMEELLRRIKLQGGEKIYVSTNYDLIPAKRMYERLGFVKLEPETLEIWQIEQACDVYYVLNGE